MQGLVPMTVPARLVALMEFVLTHGEEMALNVYVMSTGLAQHVQYVSSNFPQCLERSNQKHVSADLMAD